MIVEKDVGDDQGWCVFFVEVDEWGGFGDLGFFIESGLGGFDVKCVEFE